MEHVCHIQVDNGEIGSVCFNRFEKRGVGKVGVGGSGRASFWTLGHEMSLVLFCVLETAKRVSWIELARSV